MVELTRKLAIEENAEQTKKKIRHEDNSHSHSTPVVLRSLSNKVRIVRDELSDIDDHSDDNAPSHITSHHDERNPRTGSFASRGGAGEADSPRWLNKTQWRFCEISQIESSSSAHKRYDGSDDDDDDTVKPRSHTPNYQQSMSEYARPQLLDIGGRNKGVEDETEYAEVASKRNTSCIVRSEMEGMKTLLEEKRESFDEYLVATESESKTSSQMVGQSQERSSTINNQDRINFFKPINNVQDGGNSFKTTIGDEISLKDIDSSIDDQEFKDMVCGCPSKVLKWLGGGGKDSGSDKYIAISEDRLMNVLRALKGSGRFQSRLRSNRLNPSLASTWVPVDRLREVEKRSSIAEEQIKQCMNLLGEVDDDEDEDTTANERMRNLLSKNRMIERHFKHMKKFVEDRQKDLRKRYSYGGIKQNGSQILHSSSRSMVLPEKAKVDMQEHENHKNYVEEIQSTYDDLLSFLILENSKRLETERKNQQIFAQIKKQTDQLKRAGNVIKRTTLLSPTTTLKRSDASRQSEGNSQNNNNVLSEAMSRTYDRVEFEELEKALIEEGKTRGFSDVDLYSERKVMGKDQDTCWEYRHLHLDFNKAHDGAIRTNENQQESSEQQDSILQSSKINSSKNITSTNTTSVMRPSPVEKRDSNHKNGKLTSDDHNHESPEPKEDCHYQSSHHRDTSRGSLPKTDREGFNASCNKQGNIGEDTLPSISPRRQQRSFKTVVQSLPKRSLLLDEECNIGHDKSWHTSMAKHMECPISKATMTRENLHGSEPIVSDLISSSSNNIENLNGIKDANMVDVEEKDNTNASKEALLWPVSLHGQVKRRCKLLLTQITFFLIFLMWCIFSFVRWRVSPPPT